MKYTTFHKTSSEKAANKLTMEDFEQGGVVEASSRGEAVGKWLRGEFVDDSKHRPCKEGDLLVAESGEQFLCTTFGMWSLVQLS